ncbi:heavy metal-responsive transcriptional regulator [Thermoflexus hugenholtzii]
MTDRGDRSLRRIGELAAELGLNPRTLRYYEAIGLLHPSCRTSSGYRLYGEEEKERLIFIRKARALGFRLTEIQGILALWETHQPLCRRVRELLDLKIAEVDRQIRALKAFRRELWRLRQRTGIPARNGQICRIIEGASSPSFVKAGALPGRKARSPR